ncbi:MAG TPA: Holliday junction branch migration protein RuvA, partial [Nitrospiria bacterium]|nr:Holliday junction branch migration protein RuvA [Nitrospiria bacterium]
MIAWLNGTLIMKSPQGIVLEVNGVGYQVQVSLNTFYQLPDLKNSLSLHIHTHVREDALSLFGFMTPKERDLFLLLLGVSGIGPKLAMTILSGLSFSELVQAVQKEDLARLGTVPGIGKKTAGRVVLELKEKITDLALGDAESGQPFNGSIPQPFNGVLEEVLSALVNLGYNRLVIKPRIERLCK